MDNNEVAEQQIRLEKQKKQVKRVENTYLWISNKGRSAENKRVPKRDGVMFLEIIMYKKLPCGVP
jgi:hypothetical protein